MVSFFGSYRYIVDEKFRVNIPSKFRKALPPEADDTFIITVGPEKCLLAIPVSEWTEIEKTLPRFTFGNENLRKFVRLFYNNSCESKCDRQGRITISPKLLEYAGIDKEVVIAGSKNIIEIWNPKVFDEFQEPNLGDIEHITNIIDI